MKLKTLLQATLITLFSIMLIAGTAGASKPVPGSDMSTGVGRCTVYRYK